MRDADLVRPVAVAQQAPHQALVEHRPCRGAAPQGGDVLLCPEPEHRLDVVDGAPRVGQYLRIAAIGLEEPPEPLLVELQVKGGVHLCQAAVHLRLGVGVGDAVARQRRWQTVHLAEGMAVAQVHVLRRVLSREADHAVAHPRYGVVEAQRRGGRRHVGRGGESLVVGELRELRRAAGDLTPGMRVAQVHHDRAAVAALDEVQNAVRRSLYVCQCSLGNSSRFAVTPCRTVPNDSHTSLLRQAKISLVDACQGLQKRSRIFILVPSSKRREKAVCPQSAVCRF